MILTHPIQEFLKYRGHGVFRHPWQHLDRLVVSLEKAFRELLVEYLYLWENVLQAEQKLLLDHPN